MSHVLHLGDCIEGMAALPDRSVDHVICDPPYEAEAHTLQRRMLYNGTRARVESAPLNFGSLSEADRLSLAAHYARLSKGWIVVFCQIEAVAAWRTALDGAGARWRRGGVWSKGGMPQLTGDRPAQGCECLAIAWAGEGRSTWNGGGRNGVWEIPHQSDGPGREHPTQKPLKLMLQLVQDFTSPGDLVLDSHAGSGSTLVACKRLGRNAIGWEKDPKFHAAAVKRIEAAREQFQLPRLERKAKQAALRLADMHAPGAEAVDAQAKAQEG